MCSCHCSSECNTVTETEVAAIVHLKQAFEYASHPIHPTQQCTLAILMTSTTPSIIPLVPTRAHSHTSIHLQHYTSQHFLIHNKTPHSQYMYILDTNTKQSKLRNLLPRTTTLITTVVTQSLMKTHYAKCNSHHSTSTYLPTPLITTSTLHNTPIPFMSSPNKTPQNKLQKKHFPKSAKPVM